MSHRPVWLLFVALEPLASCAPPPCEGRCNLATEVCEIEYEQGYTGLPFKEIGYSCKPYPQGCSDHTCDCVHTMVPLGGVLADCSCDDDGCIVDHFVCAEDDCSGITIGASATWGARTGRVSPGPGE